MKMAEATTEYNWVIYNLDRHTADGIVFAVYYRIDATDGTYDAGSHGSVPLEAPPEEGYDVIPYEDLTEEICRDWAKSALGDVAVASMEKYLGDEIDEKRSPKKQTGIPWS